MIFLAASAVETGAKSVLAGQLGRRGGCAGSWLDQESENLHKPGILHSLIHPTKSIFLLEPSRPLAWHAGAGKLEAAGFGGREAEYSAPAGGASG